MSDWVHCNICIARFTSSIKFYITSCGHIVCQSCLMKQGVDNQCPRCKSECELHVISDNMESNIQAFFRPLSECVNHLIQISSFQQSNASALTKGLLNKYNMAKAEVVKSRLSIKELKTSVAKYQSKVQELTIENNKLKEMNKSQFLATTPKYDVDNSHFSNPTMLKHNLPGYHFLPPQNYSSKPCLWSAPMHPRTMNFSDRSQGSSMNSTLLHSDRSLLHTSRHTMGSLPMAHLNLGRNPKSSFHP